MSKSDARLQPAQLPQRHGLAARHGARRVGARPVRALGRRAPDRRSRCSRRRVTSTGRSRRSSPASIARRPRSRSPIRRRRGRRPGRRARRSCCCGSCSGSSRTSRQRRLGTLAGAEPIPGIGDHPRGRAGARADRGTSRVARAESRIERVHESRRPEPRLVPRPARGVRGDRVDRVVARRRPRRRRPRGDALRLGGLAHEGATRVRLPRGAERMDRAHVLGAAARRLLPRARRRLRRDLRPHRPARPRARVDGPDARLRTPCTGRSPASRARSTSRSSRWCRTRR